METRPSEHSIEVEFSSDHPKCSHGPTLLFRSSTERFFACSACRDRRDCQIFIPYEKRTTKKSKRLIEEYQREYRTFRKHLRAIQNNRKDLHQQANVRYCHTCAKLFVDDDQSEHAEHRFTDCLTREQVRRPCRDLLQPLENKRSNAQFYFSPALIDYLIKEIILPGPWDGVICIGCPTIFENLPRTCRSYLLDYDTRLCSFYSPREMLVFNMFNGHVFSPSKYFRETFLSSTKRCLVIVDPPFGGSHRALSHSIETLFPSQEIERNLILFNPYFLEKWINDAFPRLTMLDYKIEYTSNSSLHLCRGKKGSPVRIFTDLCPSKCPPIDDDNYKYCLECDRYTLLTNPHCLQCGTCPSKDGLPYRHCSLCRRCVKGERKHCSQCAVCHLPGQCRAKNEKRKSPWADRQIKRKKSS